MFEGEKNKGGINSLFSEWRKSGVAKLLRVKLAHY